MAHPNSDAPNGNARAVGGLPPPQPYGGYGYYPQHQPQHVMVGPLGSGQPPATYHHHHHHHHVQGADGGTFTTPAGSSSSPPRPGEYGQGGAWAEEGEDQHGPQPEHDSDSVASEEAARADEEAQGVPEWPAHIPEETRNMYSVRYRRRCLRGSIMQVIGGVLCLMSFWAAYVWPLFVGGFAVVLGCVGFIHFQNRAALVGSTCCCPAPIFSQQQQYLQIAAGVLGFLSSIAGLFGVIYATSIETLVFAMVAVLGAILIMVAAVAQYVFNGQLQPFCKAYLAAESDRHVRITVESTSSPHGDMRTPGDSTLVTGEVVGTTVPGSDVPPAYMHSGATPFPPGVPPPVAGAGGLPSAPHSPSHHHHAAGLGANPYFSPYGSAAYLPPSPSASASPRNNTHGGPNATPSAVQSAAYRSSSTVEGSPNPFSSGQCSPRSSRATTIAHEDHEEGHRAKDDDDGAEDGVAARPDHDM